jgi:multidrug resistance efflux pump
MPGTTDDTTQLRPLASSDRPSLSDTQDSLWRKFGGAASVEEFCASWLALQCRMIRGIAAGVVLLGTPEEKRPFAPVAYWPGNEGNLNYLYEVAERAVTERRGLVVKRQTEVDGLPQTRLDIAYPLQVKGSIYGVVALDADLRLEDAVRDVMRQLQWGAGWMEVLFHRRQSVKTPAAVPSDRLKTTVSSLATLLSQERFHGAAVALVTGLATRFGCDRVSIGFLRRGRIKVEAVSHSAQFGKDTNLLRAIAVAMEEALDQQASIVFPAAPGGKSLVSRGHSELGQQSGNKTICSIPLRGKSEIVGVITFEHPVEHAFEKETIETCESMGALIGPILEIQRRDDRWLIRKILDSARNGLGALIGPRHVGLKLATVAILAVIVFFYYAKGDYRVTAKTVIEPATRQAVVAAFNGYVSTAPLRAGDVVEKGRVLAKLDDRELRLERSKWQSQQDQNQRQYYEALGNRNAPQVQILAAQIAQARAQVALLDEQLARTEITAPIDGIIVTGDLSQSLNAPLERGQVLFELAPLDSYRVVLQVDERQIADVAVGQRGRLVLSGFASDPLDISVARLTPVSIASEGRNFFRVEATLDNVPDRLRPGMEGVGKIGVDRRRLIWIWTHEVIDWLRLKIWNWLP